MLSGEPREAIASSIELVPHFGIEALGIRPNVVINQDSMPEMPASEVARYLAWADSALRGVFLSFNQEAYSPWEGVPQVHVPTAVQRFPAFERFSRETSWDRRGYVEEAYMRAD